MTNTASPSFLDAITHINWQLEAGLHEDARDAFEHALTTLATTEDLHLLVRLADTFTHAPYLSAQAQLRSLWRRADPDLRTWLDMFVTRTDPGLYRPTEQQPRWITTVPLTAIDSPLRRVLATDDTPVLNREPSTGTEIAAKRARRRPEHIEAITTKRRPAHEDRIITEYIRTRFLRDTDHPYEPSPWDRHYVRQVAEQVRAERDRAGERTRDDFDTDAIARTRTGLDIRDDDRPAYLPNGNGLDYDHTTLAPLQGWVCVHCFGERACSDHFRTDTTGHRLSDDGLCQHCRDHDRTGIAPLPGGFTLADEVAAYCQHLTDHYPAAAPALLCDLKQRSTRTVAGLVMAYRDRATQPSASSTPIRTLTAVQLRTGRCCSCHTPGRDIDIDDLCGDCRDLYRTAA
ncbi:hypothetical protein [Nocardia pseudovaccinii]|uniref:hypothetical protein n=1 Tax=Nocardia pseudovaccinii TaxID=189540 RepID=UPI0007A539F1|nr:hypothetical protein [Nocardia pseudovaccinii]